MDYLEYDSYNDSTNSGTTSQPAQPAPPLILPLNTVTNKFKNLSILNTLHYNSKQQQQEQGIKEENQEEDVIDVAQQTAKKYSQMTLDLFEANELGLDSGSSSINNSHFVSGGSTEILSTNALSHRLSKIFNSYGYETDSTLRESLEFLQSCSFNNGIKDNNGKAQGGSKSFGSTSSPSSSSSSYVLSDQFAFRNTVETELLKSHAADLKLFSGIVGDLEEVRDILDVLNSFEFIKESKESDLDNKLKDQIQQLQQKKDLVQLKKSVLLNFKNKFMISEYEESLPYSGTLSLETFTTFNKIYETYQSSEVLMGITGSQIGVKVMAKLSSVLSSYYQCFQSYLSRSIKTNSSSSSSTISSHSSLNLKLIKLCNLFLTSNVDQYQDRFMTDFKTTRTSELMHDLKTQLNQLNVSIIDSNRYVGDILAFIHSVIVNEVEYVRGLFEINTSQEFDNDEKIVILKFQELTTTGGDNKLISLDDSSHDLLVVDIVNSLSGLLESKLSMVLNAESNLQNFITLYQSLDFYSMILGKLKLPALSIFQLIDKLQSLIVSKVISLINKEWQATITALEGREWKLDDDLLLPQDWLSSYLSETLVILDSTSSDSPIFSNQFFFNTIKDLIIAKPIEFITKQAKLNFPKMKPINVEKVREMNIFILNNLDYLKYKTLPYPQLLKSTSKEQQEDNDLDTFGITSLVDKIIENELDYTLDSLALKTPNQLITLVYPPSQIEYEEDYEMYRSLLEHKIFGLDNLLLINDTLELKIPELSIVLNDNFSKVQGPGYVNEILNKVSQGVISVYTVFFKIVWMLYEEQEIDSDEGVINDRERKVLKWSVEEFKTLIGL